MAQYLPLPDGTYYPVAEGEDPKVAWQRAMQKYPEAFGAGEPKAQPRKGLLADVMGGATNLLSIGQTGIAALTGNTNAAAQAGLERQAQQQKQYESGFQPEKILSEFDKGNYLSSAGEAIKQIPSAVAGLLPSVGQEAGLAAAGRLGGAALGAVVPIPGASAAFATAGQYALPLIVNAIQALGSQAQEKAQAQIEKGEKVDVGVAELAPYAAANAALNLVGTRIAMPSIFKKAIGQKVAAEADDVARLALMEEARKVAGRGTLNTIARGAVGFTVGELPTEILQDVVDRAAIGKPLADDDALQQYRITALNMVLGAPLGGGLGVYERGGARTQVAAQDRIEQKKQADEAKAAQDKLDAETLATKQTPEYALQAQQAYLDAEKRKAELDAQMHKASKGQKLTEDQKLDNQETQQALAENADVLNKAAKEFRQFRKFLPAAAPEAIKNTEQLQQVDMFGNLPTPKTPELDLQGKPVERAAPEPEAEDQGNLQLQIRGLSDYLDQLRAQNAKIPVTDTDAKIAIGEKYSSIKKMLAEVQKYVPPEVDTTAITTKIADLTKKMAKADADGDVDISARHATKIKELQSQLTTSPTAPSPQQEMEMQPFKSTVETTEQMQARKRQNAQQAAGAESTDYVNQRIQERRAQRKLAEKNAPPREQPQRDEELRHLAEKETVDKIVATFPAGETITPGQVMHGMGGEQAHLRDLQTQLAIAKTTRNSQAISDINEQIADIKAKQEERATSGTPIERLPQLGEGRLPEARAKEAEAEQHADKQSEMLQGFVAQLQKIKLRPDTAAVSERVAKINKAREAAGKPPITLADQSATMLDTARMAYLKSHLDEIEARRAAFGLPPMADWEIGEARARVMEGFNELQSRWGQAVDKNAPAGQRQFGAPVAAVATLQDQMRTNIYNNVASAADRLGKETKGELKEKTTTRSATPTLERDENGQLVQTGYAQPTGPQPVTERLNLQGQPKLAKDEKQNTLDMIDQVLNNLETRTTAVPTKANKAPEKVTSLADIAKLMEEETSGERTAKTDAASVELLHQLRDTLPKTSNEEFVLLAQEQVQRIMEGNLPSPYAVRELGEMIAAQKEGRRSESAPGSDLYESAQPQKSLFPETEVLQVSRATPENFQKLLDSKNVQELRKTIAEEKAGNQAALQTLQDSIAPAKTAVQKAGEALSKEKEKAAPLLESAAKERGEPTWYAPAERKVVELETALQSIPPRLKLLKDIREKMTGLNEDQKQTLLKQVNAELQKADKNDDANAVKQLFEFKQALLSKEPLTKEINRLTAAVRLAKRTIDTARADLNNLVKQHVGDKTIRESLLAQADKATERIDKLTKAFEEAQRQEARTQAKPIEEKPATEATPMATWRAALQRGREGLDLPGMRNLVDTAGLKQQILAIRQKLGSFDAQLSEIQDPKRKPKEGDKAKIAALQQKRADAITELDSVYKNAPRITSEIKEQGQLDLEKAFDEAQAGAYDLKVRKKQAKAGELPPTLRAAKKGPIVADVRTNRKSESGVRQTATPREELAAAALEQVAKGRAELKELQDRMQYLRDNNKAKKSGRYTDTFKQLQAKEESLKSNIKQAENASAVFAREAAETKAALASSRKSVEGAQTGKEALALKEAEEAREEEATSRPAVFRTITRKGASLKEQTIKRVADAITKEWSVVPDIIVIADESELPDNLRKQAERDEMIGKIPGLYDTETKKVYLIANNLFDENDIALTIAHEIAGHFGLREVLGNTYAKIMNYVYNGNASVRTAADAKMAKNKKLSREVAVEEVLAEAAEKGPQAEKGLMAALRRVWYAIKQALARVKVFNVSDAEVNQIVVNARRYVQEGKGGKPKTVFKPEQFVGTLLEEAATKPRVAYYANAEDLKNKAPELYDQIKNDLDEDATAPTYAFGELQPEGGLSRRQFLKGAAATVGALQLPATSTTMSNAQIVDAVLESMSSGYNFIQNAAATLPRNVLKALKAEAIGNEYRLNRTDEYLWKGMEKSGLEELTDLQDALFNQGEDSYTVSVIEDAVEERGIKVLEEMQEIARAARQVFIEDIQNVTKGANAAQTKTPPATIVVLTNNIVSAPQLSRSIATNMLDFGAPLKNSNAITNAANYRTKANYTSDDDLSKLAKDIVATKQGFFEKLGGEKMLRFEMLVADMRAGLRKAMEAGAKQMGDTRLFQQAMMSVTKADQKMPLVLTALSNGPLETYTDEKGFKGVRTTNENSAKEIFASTSDVPDRYGNGEAKMALATTYMIAQRAANKGLTKLDLGALGVTEEKLAAAMRQVEADPELKKALERTRSLYNKFNAGMIRFLASTGAITQKEADGFLKEGDYVPYYRVNENGLAQLVLGAGKTITIGDIRYQPHLAQLKGGETKILSLDESLPRNTMLLVEKAMTNMATRNVGYALYSVGKGNGEVNERTGKAADLMPIHKGDGPPDSGVIRWNQEPDRNDPKDTGKRWLRVQTNDTVLGGIPAEIIVKSLEGAHLTLPGFLKLGAIAGDFLRAGVTRTPVYLLRQLFRDPFVAAATAGLDYGPIKAIYKAGNEYLKMNTGQSETAAKLIEKGLIQSGIFTGDPDDISKFALQLASGKDMGVMDKFFAMADAQAMKADAATRVLVYDNAIKNGLSEVEADMAVMESMNFHKRGLSPTVQYASRMIPFFNSQIQGLNVLFKAATGNMPFNEQLRIKQKFQNNAMMLMGMGLVYAMMMEDDEYFKNAKPRDKYSNFFIPLPGVDEPLKLPIPYEFGWFFSAAVAAADAMKAETDGPQQLRALRDMFVGAIPGSSSLGVPQIVKPLAEVYTNKNFFSGFEATPLESARLRKLDPEARYYDTTTEMAKQISKMVPILSPIQIEHIVTGYLGSLPLMAAAATDGLFKGQEAAETPTRRLSQMPLIGSSFQRKYGGEDADVVYKLATEALQAKATFNEYKNTGKLNEAKEYFQEHRAELAVAPMALQYEKFMGNLRKQEQIIRQSSMPADKKQERIDLLDKQRQLQSERYAQAIKRAEAAVGRTTPQ